MTICSETVYRNDLCITRTPKFEPQNYEKEKEKKNPPHQKNLVYNTDFLEFVAAIFNICLIFFLIFRVDELDKKLYILLM